MAIDIVEAKNKDEATRIATENNTVYANQFLEAVAESKANSEDWNSVHEYKSQQAANNIDS